MALFIDHHTVRVWHDPNGPATEENLLAVLYWGDDIESATPDGRFTRLELGNNRHGWAKGPIRTRPDGLLELVFVDVGQGDACLMVTPNRARILIDGGENKQAARYLASRFNRLTNQGLPLDLDAIVVTHGDADHFSGLFDLIIKGPHEVEAKKVITVTAQRVYHSGLVKRPTARPELERLGVTEDDGKALPLIVGLVDDPRNVPDEELNAPFKEWKRALNEMSKRKACEVRRIDSTSRDAFSFLTDVKVEVLGPRVEFGPTGKPGLRFLPAERGGLASASRTINGHSIVLMITHKKARLLFTGDMTAHTEDELLSSHRAGALSLDAHLLKVPHHGSSDVSIGFLQAVHPMVSIISAGDEDAMRDYLHPRANVLGALGRAGRGDDSLIFVTNLAAFDRWAGKAFRAIDEKGVWKPDTASGVFNARERTVFGRIHVRTDGERLFVSRFGARKDRHETYCFDLDEPMRRVELDAR